MISTPLKILQVTAALSEGGVERGTLEMASYTIDQGAQSYVASSGGKLVPALEKSGAVHFTLPLHRRNPFAILYSSIMLVKIIRKHQIDLIHARSRAPAWAALLASKITSTSFVTTFHGTHKIQNKLKQLYNSSMVRGERVIAISEFIKAHVVDKYGVSPSTIDIAPRGVDVELFSPQKIAAKDKSNLRDSLNIKDDALLITLPGRLTRWKGQTVFLEALATIKDLPDWVAMFVGGSGKKLAYEHELKKLCKQFGLEERVVFAGSQMNMPLYYAISDIVVSASTEPEAFGRVAVEAQAMQKPVIASAHGGSLETVLEGETGWLTPPNNSECLSDVIRNALLEPDCLERMGLNGRKWVTDNFTVRQTCEAEWNAYETIVKGA